MSDLDETHLFEHQMSHLQEQLVAVMIENQNPSELFSQIVIQFQKVSFTIQ